MSISYHVYANDYAGGPVDYATVVATVTTPTYTPAAVPAGSDVTFAVRAFDTVTGFEELNLTARFRLVTDAAGNSLNARPATPAGLSTRLRGPGTVLVKWAWPYYSGQNPDGFYVYYGYPTPDYTTARATVAYHRGLRSFSATLSGLTGGSPLVFGVLAYKGTLKGLPVQGGPAVPGTAAPAAVIPIDPTVSVSPRPPFTGYPAPSTMSGPGPHPHP